MEATQGTFAASARHRQEAGTLWRAASPMNRIKLAVAALLTASVSPLVGTTSAGAAQMPKVWVGGPNPAPCYRVVKLKGKFVDRTVACYEVRPPTIALSEDGNFFLSDLHWSSWTTTKAVATGERFVRCYGGVNAGKGRCAGKVGNGYEVATTVTLTKPASSAHGLVFTTLWIAGFSSSWTLEAPPHVAPTTTTPRTPNVIGGAWEFVGFSTGQGAHAAPAGQAVDVVHLTLVNFPAGHLSGTWNEATVPYYSSLALNGTECIGCNGVAGAYANSFSVTGSVSGGTFTIQIEDNGNVVFSGALGSSTPYGTHRYGCAPVAGTQSLFLVADSSAYMFYRPSQFPGVAVGRPSGCL